MYSSFVCREQYCAVTAIAFTATQNSTTLVCNCSAAANADGGASGAGDAVHMLGKLMRRFVAFNDIGLQFTCFICEKRIFPRT